MTHFDHLNASLCNIDFTIAFSRTASLDCFANALSPLAVWDQFILACMHDGIGTCAIRIPRGWSGEV